MWTLNAQSRPVPGSYLSALTLFSSFCAYCRGSYFVIDVVSVDGVSVRLLPPTNSFGLICCFSMFFFPHVESVTCPTGSPQYSWTGSFQVRAAILVTLSSPSAFPSPCSEYPINHRDNEDVKWGTKNCRFAECHLEYGPCRARAVFKPGCAALNTRRVPVGGGVLFWWSA